MRKMTAWMGTLWVLAALAVQAQKTAQSLGASAVPLVRRAGRGATDAVRWLRRRSCVACGARAARRIA
jgi:hypothetical protein